MSTRAEKERLKRAAEIHLDFSFLKTRGSRASEKKHKGRSRSK